MGRYPQGLCPKGSQRWMQWFVNHAPAVIDEQIGLGSIDWRSPLAADGYAEYRDETFLDLLGIKLLHRPLDSFWPRGGPQWDALGQSQSGTAVLVEAKAHLNELYSPATGASSESSVGLIRESLAEVARALHVRPDFDWSKQFYQYANRLAHANFLEHVNRIPTKLVFVYFMGDPDMNGPGLRSEWETAIKVVQSVLGLTEQPAFVQDVFIDVRPYCLIQQTGPADAQ